MAGTPSSTSSCATSGVTSPQTGRCFALAIIHRRAPRPRTCRRHSRASSAICLRISPATFAATTSAGTALSDERTAGAMICLWILGRAARRAFDQPLLALRVIRLRVREPRLERMLPHACERIADHVVGLLFCAAASASSGSSRPCRSRSWMSSEPPTWRPLMKTCGNVVPPLALDHLAALLGIAARPILLERRRPWTRATPSRACSSRKVRCVDLDAADTGNSSDLVSPADKGCRAGLNNSRIAYRQISGIVPKTIWARCAAPQHAPV